MPGYGTPLSLTLPTIDGVATEAQAAPLINTALSAIIARLESKVAATDLDIASDVSFKSGAVFSGATDLQRAAFQSQTGALTAVSNPNTVYVLNGDLHYIDASGNLVQITASGAVNVSTTGGITGSGYGTGGVEVNWDSGNTRFSFRSGAGTDDFADVQCADLLLRDASGNQIRFQAPAIASDYALSLPSALPASTSLLQVSSAGLMSTSTAPTLTGLTVNGPVTISGDLSSGSLTTTSTGVAAATNTNITVSGTGQFKHGSRQILLSAALALPDITNTPGVVGNFDFGTASWSSTGTEGLVFGLPLLVGDRVESIEVMSNGFGTAGTRTIELILQTTGSGAATVVVSATSTATGSGFKTFNIADTLLGSTGIYSIRFSQSAGNDSVSGIRVTYDHP